MSNKEFTPEQAEIRRLSFDLHDALTEVPLEMEYFKKLELYGQKLIEQYNWHRVEVYSTHEQLDTLATGTRVTTSDNALAVKHPTGWVILSQEGYTYSYNLSTDLVLPVFSIPETRHSSQNAVSLDDGTQDVSQVPETGSKR